MQQTATPRPVAPAPTTKKPAPRPKSREPRHRLKVASLAKWLDLCG